MDEPHGLSDSDHVPNGADSPLSLPAPAEPREPVGERSPPNLVEAVTATPAYVPPLGTDLPLVACYPVPRRRLSAILWPVTLCLLTALATLFVSPLLAARWRSLEGKAEAEAAYARRRAELRAEAEAAVGMLDVLDKRVNLVSLGFREVVRKVTPSVVNVANFREVRGGERLGRSEPLLFDPETDRPYRQTGVGSGILVRPGYVLTNHHVVRSGDRFRITFASGQVVDLAAGEKVLADAVTDLALLRLPADLPAGLAEAANVTTEFADSDRDVQRGDLVLALGSPLGLKHTVTHGIISAKGRLLDRVTLVELIQTDAAINPGNSGGPLFDQFGRLVGVNVAIASENGGNQGIGFAIPSNTVKKIVDQLVTHGEVARGYIGVAMEELTREQVRGLGLKKTGGVQVVQVVPGQAAGKAGLRPGDVIVGYNKDALGAVNPMRQLRQWILETEVGQEVPVEVVRDGERRTLTVRIGKRPADLP
jgi:S1-C subfamily serine protease